MPSYDSSLEDIKNRIDIVDLISEYVHLKQAGQNWKGLCPFHTEKTPSFIVSPAKQIFHCFGCGVGGDIFSFLVRYESLTFPEALNMLAKKAGVELKRSATTTAKSGEKENLLDIQRLALDFFIQNLSKAPKALEYLKGRGITTDILKDFSIGYAPKSWNALLNFLGRKGHRPETVKKAGLASQGQKGIYDSFRDRIIFPIQDLKGDVVAFGGRTIDGSEPKYLNSPETIIFNKRRVLYGLDRAKNAIKDKGYVLFMEGYLDVIAAHIYDFKNSVAPLGTAITPEHGKLIKRFTDNALLVFDSDPAGIKAAKNAANILFESGLNVKVLSFPGDEDPDSFLRKKGRSGFEQLLKRPLSIIDFIMEQKDDRRAMAREALETISKISDRILQGEYIRTLSEKLNIRESLVLEQLKRVKSGPVGGVGKAPPSESGKKRKPSELEMLIIKLIIDHPGMLSEIYGEVKEEDLRTGAIRSIFKKAQEGAADFNELMLKCDRDEKEVLSGISMRDDLDNPGKVLKDCIRRVRENRLKRLDRELDIKMKEAERAKDMALLKRLQEEKLNLLKSRKSL